MTRAISTAAKGFIHARAPGGAVLQLVRIVHADLAATLRFSTDGAAVVSGADTYLPRFFDLPLPNDVEGQVEVPFALDVTDLDDAELLVLLSAAGDFPEVVSDLVLGADPDTVEATFYFQLRNATLDGGRLQGSCRYEPFLTRPWPGFIYDSTGYPDLFA